MSTLHFRQYMTESEQNLLAGLTDEFTQIYGVSVFYIPRVQLNTDKVMPDSKLSKFYNAYPCTVYIKNIEGFGGQGNFLNQFGLELRDQITFTMSRQEFERSIMSIDPRFQFTGETWSGTPILRPHEGDVIYLPLNQKMYQIRFVEHETPFYPLGKLQSFDLQSELYAPNNELYDTGVPEIDAIFARFSPDTGAPVPEDTGDDSDDIVSEANTVMNLANTDPFGYVS